MFFRVVLWSLGALLSVASRFDSRLRAQITRDMTAVVASRDGISRSYIFRNRRVSSHAGATPNPTLLLTFATPADGARILTAPDAVLRIVRGLAAKEIDLVGMPAHVLWFYEMAMGYVPWRRKRYHVAPNAYVAPDFNSVIAEHSFRIVATSPLPLQTETETRHRAPAARV